MNITPHNCQARVIERDHDARLAENPSALRTDTIKIVCDHRHGHTNNGAKPKEMQAKKLEYNGAADDDDGDDDDMVLTMMTMTMIMMVMMVVMMTVVMAMR